MDQKIKILIADDHHLVRKGFRALLEEFDFIEVAGEDENRFLSARIPWIRTATT